jgi:ribonuclease-3
MKEVAYATANGIPANTVFQKYGTWNNGESVVFTQTYESLEFVGDGWIGAIVGDYLYHRFPRQNEGFLTKLKQNIVCKDGLAGLARYIGFDKFILLSTRNEENYGRMNLSYLEDVFEAFCAAIKQDLGKQVLDLFIKNIIEASIDFERIITVDTNYKDMLMRFCQENGWGQPTYGEIAEEGQKHHKLYTIGVDYIEALKDISVLPEPYVADDGSLYIAVAKCKSKKEAQKQAARLSLELFKKYLKIE